MKRESDRLEKDRYDRGRRWLIFFIIQLVKARATPCPHQMPTRGDNTVLVAQDGIATPGTTKQLLQPDRVFKRINSLADVVCFLAEWSDTKSNLKLGGFRSQLQASYVSSHTEELWYNETVCLWKTIYIYIYIYMPDQLRAEITLDVHLHF